MLFFIRVNIVMVSLHSNGNPNYDNRLEGTYKEDLVTLEARKDYILAWGFWTEGVELGLDMGKILGTLSNLTINNYELSLG